MTKGITVRLEFGRKRRRNNAAGKRKAAFASRPVARVSRLMALAIRFDQLINERAVADQAELARLGHVSRARLTQIMNLLNLAPEIQAAVMNLSPPTSGRNPLSERQLRPIAATISWRKQRQRWERLCTT